MKEQPLYCFDIGLDTRDGIWSMQLIPESIAENIDIVREKIDSVQVTVKEKNEVDAFRTGYKLIFDGINKAKK
jgi:hypothetical protein